MQRGHCVSDVSFKTSSVEIRNSGDAPPAFNIMRQHLHETALFCRGFRILEGRSWFFCDEGEYDFSGDNRGQK